MAPLNTLKEKNDIYNAKLGCLGFLTDADGTERICLESKRQTQNSA